MMYIAYRLSPSIKYRTFTIPKKSGGFRNICAPNGALLNLQKDIKLLLEKDYHPRAHVHGFVTGQHKGIYTNAEKHVRKKWVLNFDLENFFETIHFGRISGRLQSNPYNYTREIAQFVAHIACYQTFYREHGEVHSTSVLMTGGALSPILSNIVTDRLDGELSRFCASLGCTYTRYADDITISSNRNRFPTRIAAILNPDDHRSAVLSDELQDIVEGNGFRINHAKTRLLRRSFRQEVTGLVVNQKTNVTRNFVRQVRAMLHDWSVNGYQIAAENHFLNHRRNRGRLSRFEANNFDWIVRGKIEFIRHIKGETDQVFQKLANQYNSLTLYRKFHIPITAENDLLREAVWYLENDSGAGFGGTCFAIKGNRFVTCWHCVGDNLRIYLKRAPAFPVNVPCNEDDSVNDLAILDSSSLAAGLKPKSVLEIASIQSINSLKVGSKVQLAGYPGNINEGDVTIREATIERFSRRALAGC